MSSIDLMNFSGTAEDMAKMIKENGVQLRSFNDEVWDGFGTAAEEVFEETRAHSDLAKKIDASYQGALREMGGYRAKAEIAYSVQRNRVLGIEE